jgi:hypothetical protein
MDQKFVIGRGWCLVKIWLISCPFWDKERSRLFIGGTIRDAGSRPMMGI